MAADKEGSTKTQSVPGWERFPALEILAVVAIFWSISSIPWVSLTITLAALLALSVNPVDDWFKDRLPDKLGWVGLVASMLLVLTILALYILALIFVARDIVAFFPQYAEQLDEELTGRNATGVMAMIGDWLDSATGREPGEDQTGESVVTEFIGTVSSIAETVARSAGAAISMTVLVFFLTLIFLGEKETWSQKIDALFSKERSGTVRDIVDDVGRRLHIYIRVRTLLSIVTALLYGIALMLLNVDLIWIWVTLTFLLSFVPNLGSLVSGLLPFFFTLATKDVSTAFILGTYIYLVEQILGNYLEPRLQGRELQLSTSVVLVSILFWGFLWGLAGTLIAVPMTMALVVAAKHFDATRNIALFLGNKQIVASNGKDTSDRSEHSAPPSDLR